MAPRLRSDLVATTADDQGVMCVEVTDPLTSISFRFYDFEYALAQQLTGQPLQDVIEWANTTFGVDLSAETLDQFIEKLAGLGFLMGGSSGAQPEVLAPFSPSTISQPIEGLPTPEDGEGLPIPVLPPTPSVGTIASVAPYGNAIAPEGLNSGDATEYLLRDSDRGLWEQGNGSGSGQPHGGQGQSEEQVAPPGPTAVDNPVPPGLQALGTPLPPVAASADEAPISDADGRAPQAAASIPTAAESEAASSPLASIVYAISVETSGPAPAGALDIGGTNTPSSPVIRDARVTARSGPAWTKEVAREVEQPRGDRRQPPRPEVVVMPPVAEPPATGGAPQRRSAALVLVLLLLLAGAAGAAYWFFYRPTTTTTSAPTAELSSVPLVHVASPQPTTFYRWFDKSGIVIPGRDDTLSFSAGGRLQDAMPPKTTFAAGETIARLQGVAARELIVNKLRSHVAYYEQLRESSRAEGAEGTARQAEAKLAARKQELAAAQAGLRQLEIHPKVAGEIAELLVTKGAFVKPGTPVFRIRAAGPRATFTMSPEDIARARGLGFCRVETIPGAVAGGAGGATGEAAARPIDCSLSPPATGGGGTRLAVDLIGATGMVPGTQVRLARARHDAVFPVPRAALSREGGEDRLWVVSGGGKTAESRVVDVAATVDDIGLVGRGLTVGDAVIVDPPADLKSGAEVAVAH